MAFHTLVRKGAYIYLILCGIGACIFFAFRLYKEFAPSKVKTENIPFGLQPETELLKGDLDVLLNEEDTLAYGIRGELDRAFDLAENGSYAEALGIFEALALNHPHLGIAKIGAINTMLSMDSLTEQESKRLEALKLNVLSVYKASSFDFYLKSKNAYLTSSLSVALDFARHAAEASPSFFIYRLWYAKLLYESGKYTLAETEAKAAISLSLGKSSKAYRLLATVYHYAGQLDSCSSVVEYALSKFQTNPYLMLLQGYLNEYRGNFEAAEKIYQKILAIHYDFNAADKALATLGEKSPPGNGLGVSLTPYDRAKVACDILEPLVLQYPDNLPLREALGRAYLKGRNFDLAREQFLKIQELDSEYPDIRLRLQEATAVRTIIENPNNSGLAENLNRVADSLRIAKPSTAHDFSSMLGHYLVRYGAKPKEFFSHYAISNFKQIKPMTWQESFSEKSYTHTYTVLFDKKAKFYGVHVLVVDSLAKNEYGRAPEIYTKLVQQNSRISGIGSATGETECEDFVVEASVFDSPDNFEMIMRIIGRPKEVRMVRFDKQFLPMGLKLCDYIPYLMAY